MLSLSCTPHTGESGGGGSKHTSPTSSLYGTMGAPPITADSSRDIPDSDRDLDLFFTDRDQAPSGGRDERGREQGIDRASADDFDAGGERNGPPSSAPFIMREFETDTPADADENEPLLR